MYVCHFAVVEGRDEFHLQLFPSQCMCCATIAPAEDSKATTDLQRSSRHSIQAVKREHHNLKLAPKVSNNRKPQRVQ